MIQATLADCGNALLLTTGNVTTKDMGWLASESDYQTGLQSEL